MFALGEARYRAGASADAAAIFARLCEATPGRATQPLALACRAGIENRCDFRSAQGTVVNAEFINLTSEESLGRPTACGKSKVQRPNVVRRCRESSRTLQNAINIQPNSAAVPRARDVVEDIVQHVHGCDHTGETGCPSSARPNVE